MKYTSYLFDLDGVLVNTDEIQYKTTSDAILHILNYNISCDCKIESVFRSTITTLEKLHFLSTYLALSEDIIHIIYEKKKELANSYFSKLKVDNEKIELMTYLKNNKCKIAVVTNSNKNSAQIVLKNIGIYEFIDVIIANEDVINKKPDPEPYLTAIEKIESSKEECVIFEDSEIGLISARATGCYFYHVKSYLEVNTKLVQSLNM